LLPQRASLKRASKAADPNFVLWVEIKIFYLAHCMTVPVNFDRGAVRSGIRQIGKAIAVVSQLYAVVQALYAVLLTLYAMLSFNFISIFFPWI
jgi:hypothetical protein